MSTWPPKDAFSKTVDKEGRPSRARVDIDAVAAEAAKKAADVQLRLDYNEKARQRHRQGKAAQILMAGHTFTAQGNTQ